MAVEICVWLPAKVTNITTGEVSNNIGHASILIGANYLSFWPREVSFDITAALPVESVFNTYKGDVKDEGGPPDHSVKLQNLDENAMQVFYQRMIAVKPPYYGRGFNCAGPVKVALYLGSGGKSPTFKVFASRAIYQLPEIINPKIDEWARECWTPNDVNRYAGYLKKVIG